MRTKTHRQLHSPSLAIGAVRCCFCVFQKEGGNQMSPYGTGNVHQAEMVVNE